MLELKLYNSFVAVAEEQHFLRAARRLHITQPALSRQIQQLEREVGAQLFTRVGRTAQLTVAGQVFLEHARRLLEMADAAALAARNASQGIIGPLVVGFVSPATYSVLPASSSRARTSVPRSPRVGGSTRRARWSRRSSTCCRRST
ncbi:MAG: LysR family transcriptional regulator [bacterium]